MHCFFGKFKAAKSHSEINWPLWPSLTVHQFRRSSSKDNFSGLGCIFSNSPSVGVRRSKAKRGQDECCYSFFFSFFCRGRDIFAKIKHTKLTYYSIFISCTRSTNIQKSAVFFSRETDVVNRSSFFSLFFISRFFFWPFLTFKLVAMVRGTQFLG